MVFKRFAAVIAFGCFFVSLGVHLVTFFGINPARYVPWIWALHLGIFVLCIPLFYGQGLKPPKGYWARVMADLPVWARYVYKGFGAYAFINFALFLFLVRGGSPEVQDGKYVLTNHARVVRELSQDEYDSQMALVFRGFSGHWMAFYLLPGFVYWYGKGGKDIRNSPPFQT